ncbi:hypothetical protein B0A52_01822 [Exophiala mesophila]|uniref:Putative peptidase domain-containing protein n=1 Tax=Exophiala mesophila TaxID=212818 RepID=A0A438NG52_EXOME|nr:hypothetical protein B0A52_01822 [Exophiala mesophila]
MSRLIKATVFLTAISGVFAAPAQLFARQDSHDHGDHDHVDAWDAGAVTQYQIHSSCNATQAHQIAVGLNETIQLVSHARDHVLRWGNTSEIYQRYFGGRAPYEVLGAYDIIINGDKDGVLFRCDNPDGNCDIEGWGGHWRGSNATSETVICDLSYETRRSLNQICALGYTVSESPRNTFWASDLLHRLYHIPAVGYGYIEHFADGYEEILELAQTDEIGPTRDTDTLQYFALDVYAYDIAVPGVGCNSPETETESGSSDSTAPTTTSTGSPTVPEPSTSTVSVPAGCHTHEGGELHC